MSFENTKIEVKHDTVYSIFYENMIGKSHNVKRIRQCETQLHIFTFGMSSLKLSSYGNPRKPRCWAGITDTTLRDHQISFFNLSYETFHKLYRIIWLIWTIFYESLLVMNRNSTNKSSYVFYRMIQDLNPQVVCNTFMRLLHGNRGALIETFMCCEYHVNQQGKTSPFIHVQGLKRSMNWHKL